MRRVTEGPGRTPSIRCGVPTSSMMVNWPSPNRRARTWANSIAVLPRQRAVGRTEALSLTPRCYLLEMLNLMAISRQRVCTRLSLVEAANYLLRQCKNRTRYAECPESGGLGAFTCA